ncbi:MAG: DUF983 domain-containing protein [Rickettsiales bacterium]
MSNIWSVIVRGSLGKCPSCNQGDLFSKYLRQVVNCNSCDEYFGNISADDGPAWLTILIVGHLIAPFIIMFSPNNNWPDWLLVITWSIISIMLILIILPRAKGVFISILWYLKNK